MSSTAFKPPQASHYRQLTRADAITMSHSRRSVGPGRKQTNGTSVTYTPRVQTDDPPNANNAAPSAFFTQPCPDAEQADSNHQRCGHHNQTKPEEQLKNDDRWQQRQSNQLQN